MTSPIPVRGFYYKGAVPQAQLPASGNTRGDLYSAAESGSLWAWDGGQWINLNAIGALYPPGTGSLLIADSGNVTTNPGFTTSANPLPQPAAVTFTLPGPRWVNFTGGYQITASLSTAAFVPRVDVTGTATVTLPVGISFTNSTANYYNIGNTRALQLQAGTYTATLNIGNNWGYAGTMGERWLQAWAVASGFGVGKTT